MVEKDFSLLIGLSVALTVFLVVSLTSIRILRRKGRSPSMYTMTNLSKQLFFIFIHICQFTVGKLGQKWSHFFGIERGLNLTKIVHTKVGNII